MGPRSRLRFRYACNIRAYRKRKKKRQGYKRPEELLCQPSIFVT